jgi:uncharacterized protein (DUF305 family)
LSTDLKENLMSKTLNNTLKLAAVVAAMLALAACGASSDTGSSAPSSSQSGSATSSKHNDADVSFATDMIPHHAQAVVMAKMARTQASDPKVKALAADIEVAQGPEIEQMSGWLKAWGEKVPATDTDAEGSGMSGMGGRDSGDMPGMMSDGQMTRLGKVSGAMFDRMWLQMMVQHHEGAVEMAKTEQSDGQSSDAVALAKRIESAQTAEISKMQEMLGV